jgi:hypothetical protein
MTIVKVELVQQKKGGGGGGRGGGKWNLDEEKR